MQEMLLMTNWLNCVLLCYLLFTVHSCVLQDLKDISASNDNLSEDTNAKVGLISKQQFEILF